MARVKRKDAGGSAELLAEPPAEPPGVATPGIPGDAPGSVQVGEGRVRAVIDAVLPAVDGGRFAIKRIAGEPVRIEAHCFTDGHDRLRAALRWQSLDSNAPGFEVEMQAEPNDVWVAGFTPPLPGRYRYTVTAWVDHFESWRHELGRREEVNDVRAALLTGALLIDDAASRANSADAALLTEWSAQLRDTAQHRAADVSEYKSLALDPARAHIAARYADRRFAAISSLELVADRKRAAFSSWYELFPRSAGEKPGIHGTFKDVESRLPYLKDMGFDVLYFPPIHPIGRANRKGTNNSLSAAPEDVGSPWAIGAAEGGHKQILAQLGSFADFDRLLGKARDSGMEIALDLAFQCAPDHPYVTEHPQWFKHRPDGSIQYAENPPKKYQDIYPFDFETDDWRALWDELKSVVDFWIARGVKIFRVDNPHTKSFGFWEWLIAQTKREHPDLIYLAEAFTRPKVMHRLAKLGFTQSYTYFTWRNSKQELTAYFTELTRGPGYEYYRPNVWPNTPDILPETLQSGSRAMYSARLILAATLSANYGIYGPTYELMESAAREPGGEEYQDSEKYQLRHWSLRRPDSLMSLIARMNLIRRENAALQSDLGLHFCGVDNEQLIAYFKTDAESENVILTVVNLDVDHPQSGWIDLNLGVLKYDEDQPYQAHDLLSEQRYIWRGRFNFVRLDPARAPAHVFRMRRRIRSEHDFDYYL